MQFLIIICGCAAWAGMVVTRKAGPFGLFRKVRAWGTTFQCATCLSALAGVITWGLLWVPYAAQILVLPAALGYALALMALAGIIDMGDD